MVRLCPFCGPKMSAFCMVISGWGVVFLGLLGVFFYIQAVTLFPDLHFHEENPTTEQIAEQYSAKAVQCWVAGGMYLVTMIVAFAQYKWNNVAIF